MVVVSERHRNGRVISLLVYVFMFVWSYALLIVSIGVTATCQYFEIAFASMPQ